MSSSLSRLELIYSVGFSRRSALSTLFTELIINLLRNREEEHTFVGSKTRTAMIVHLQVGVHTAGRERWTAVGTDSWSDDERRAWGRVGALSLWISVIILRSTVAAGLGSDQL